LRTSSLVFATYYSELCLLLVFIEIVSLFVLHFWCCYGYLWY